MVDSIAGVVLAAGAGVRLRPLTRRRPKVLCPVGDRFLVDHALARFDGVTSSIAVNVHHHRDQLESHLAGRVHLSLEEPEALGTAGALAHLHGWIDGRAVLVVNGDTWCPTSVTLLVDGWDGERARILSPDAAPFGAATRLAGALLPWRDLAKLAPVPSGLYESVWRAADVANRLEVVTLPEGAAFVDCGTPADYLAANMAWSGGASVVGAGASVAGTVERCVVWPGSVVLAQEHLVGAIRYGDRQTVLVR
jgi:MurNAc alpha-1-phosphate uridylyltransferase